MEISSLHATKAKSPRLLGLDQARAVAILAMMVFHFAPGVFVQLPKLEPIRDPVLWFGRSATPMFVTVFGVTVGFVFLPKYLRGEIAGTSRRLWRRALLIFFCSILITLPQWIRLSVREHSTIWEWFFALYSVLLFYAIALALLPFWLRWLTKQSLARSLAGGVLLWVMGTLGYRLWPGGEQSLPEFFRMVLLSGDYGYLQMMGTTLLAIPIGLRLRRLHDVGKEGPYLWQLLIGGCLLAAFGAAWGWFLGEYDLARIIAGEMKIPPRPWYFLHFGSLAVVLLAGLEFLSRGVRVLSWPMYILALCGQVSLVLYTGHLFVLPFLEVVGHFTSLKGLTRVLVAFVPFLIFCVVVVYGRHRQQKVKPSVV